MLDLIKPHGITSDIKLDDKWYRISFMRYGTTINGNICPMVCLKDGDTDNPTLEYIERDCEDNDGGNEKECWCEFVIGLHLYDGEQSKFGSGEFAVPYERGFTFQQVEHFYTLCLAAKETAQALLINAYRTNQDTN